jgi:site-specific DNA-methyltransferase (adenine-specific)
MEKVKISAIKANSKNPRVIKDDKFKKLVKSIQDFPEMLEKRPLVCFTDVDGKYVVLGGNMRLKAAQEVGLKELPIVLADDWTQEQRDEFLIKDNVGFGEWDWDQLANEWDAGKLDEWGLDVPNFDGEVLEAEEDDFDITPPDEPITVLGDLYEIGEHRLLCGDSTDSDQVEKLMNGQKADMVFTDPPYRVSFQGQRISNTTKDGVVIHGHKGANTKHNEIENDSLSEDDFKDFMSGVLSNLFMFNKGAWYICFAYSELHLLLNSLVDAGYKWKNIIIWMKNQAALSNMDYKSRYEPIIYGQPGSCFYGERYKQEDIWEFQRTLKNDLHPTLKPIPLIENALNNSSKQGMNILDLFLGSGSTMVASHQLKRKCYGMELDPKYCDVIVNRMIALDPNIEIKLNGKPFEKAH